MKMKQSMRQMRTLGLAVLTCSAFFSLFVLTTCSAAEQKPLQISSFECEITPTLGKPIGLGFIPFAKTVEHPLLAKGVVLKQGSGVFVLCTLDLTEIHDKTYFFIRDKIAQAAGTKPSCVALHCLHQHTAPALSRTLQGLQLEENDPRRIATTRYEQKITANIVEQIKKATASFQPVTHIGTSKAKVDRVASNRRLERKDGSIQARLSSTKDAKMQAAPEGLIDPWLRTLSFVRDGKALLQIHYYATHPQSFYGDARISYDTVGIARERLQKQSGVPQIYFTGCGGDIAMGKYNNGSRQARTDLANRLFDAMKRSVAEMKIEPVSPLSWQTLPVQFPTRREPSYSEQASRKILADKKANFGAKLKAGFNLAWVMRAKKKVPVELSCLTIGSAKILHLPGEPFVQYQLAAQKMELSENVFVAGYGDCGMGYIGGDRIFTDRGGYEQTYAFAGPCEQLMLDSIRTLLIGKAIEQAVAVPLETSATKPKNKDDFRIPGRSPEEALKSFAVPDGFEMQLVAQEPHVRDPILITYDENGLMYVAEYLKFPNHPLEGKSDSGRVRLLKDADGDGHYEQSFVFADGITWPTGICPWNGGVYVVAAPDLWYLKDTDGDGKADIKKKIYTGFGFNNEEGTANNLIWGLDNWIYGAGSNSGGTVRPADKPNARGISMRGRDFRFHPVTGKFETLSGSEQFGNTFDNWGDRFICSNSKPVVHVVLPSRYLARNPYLPVPAVRKSIWVSGNGIYRISPPEAWRVARSRYRLSKKPNMAKTYVADDVFSACSAATIYRGSVYPKQYQGNMFMGEVQGNLISRFDMRPNGVTFDAVRVDIKKEVLASRDNWFRPANLCNAPDGTMHIVDMCREVIETPTSMTEEIIANIDLLSGDDRGRIYRLAPTGFKAPSPPQLGKMTTAQLVQTLENKNGWWRDTASRLLYERQDKQTIKPLQKLLHESKYDLAQLHAMYALDGLSGLRDEDILFALSSESDGLKEHAVKLAESRLQKNSKLLTAVVSLADSPNTKVRFQVAFSLGETDDKTAAEALASIAKRDAGDVWMRTAVLSSSLKLAGEMLESLLADSKFAATSGGKQFLRQLALVVGGRNQKAEVIGLLKALESTANSKNASAQRYVLLGLGDGLRRSRSSLSQYTDQSPTAAKLVNSMIANAEKVLSKSSSTASQKSRVIEVLAHGKFDDVSELLFEMLDSRQAPAVQLAATRTLADFKNAEVSTALVEAWQGLSPSVRGEVVETLLGRSDGITALLDAIENKEISAGFISPVRKDRLLKHRDTKVQTRAKKLFASGLLNPRKKVLDDYRAALSLKGDAANGKKVFEQNCMTCHKIGKSGHEVGPNLATIQNATPETLLIQMIDPNREVLANYTQYIVVLESGRVVTGIITSESPTSITLKRAENVKETILRQNIDEITGTGKSLMPEGLEQKIDKQQMQDLITFLQELKK